MPSTLYTLDSFGVSDVGLVREHNEDVFAAFPEEGFFLLADGMGGHLAGEVAAREAIQHLTLLVKKWKTSRTIPLEEAEQLLKEALIATNRFIYEKGQKEPSLNGMGTTLCALLFFNEHAIVGHVGDSRLYCLRKGRLMRLTEDHSLISEMIAIGAMREGEGKTFPYKHVLTRAIGTHPQVEPTVNHFPCNSADLYMLCSDGLTNFVTDEEIKEILSKQTPLTQKGKEFVDLANLHGGGDNITVLIVKIQNDLS